MVPEWQRGDRITAEGVGALTVVGVYRDDEAGDVEVDVQADRECDIWDADKLAKATGATAASWLSGVVEPRYRLYFAAAES